MVRKAFILLMLAAIGIILFGFTSTYTEKEALPAVSSHYINEGPAELGSANVVTSVVVTYRGLGTLGEVTILFAAAAVVGLLIHLNQNENRPRREGSELLKTASVLLFPLILLFGVYVFVNGHLSPGGGFQGGAIIASGVVLTVLANPNRELGHRVLAVIESLSGLLYIGIGAAGAFFIVNGFLDNRLLPLGDFGTLLSGGLIPVIYSVIGLKVGSELSSVVITLNGKTVEGGLGMIGTVAISTGAVLVLVGLWGALSNKDVIRMIVGFSIFDVGIHIIMISVGHIAGGTAPIISSLSEAGVSYVDPVPQALVLTAIVIGLGITAFMLTYAVNMHKRKGTLEIDKFEELKW